MKAFPTILQSLGLLGIMLLSAIAAGLLVLPFLSMQSALAQTLVYSICLSLTIFFALQFRGNKNLSWVGFRPEILLIGLFLVIPYQITIDPIRSLFELPDFLKSITTSLNVEPITMLVMVGLAAPILEEILFRGIILDGYLKNTYHPWLSIVLSALLFALIHGNMQQGIGAFGMGIFFGWIYKETKSLYAVILLHAANNFTACFFMFAFPEHQNVNSISELIDNLIVYIILITISFLIVAGGIMLIKKRYLQTVEIKDPSTSDLV